jgi:glycosyltransferase involved in cell wall biosynthesis
MPFFTIIIPTYNRASLVYKAVKSVLDQTFSDLELLVIDDGSTDHTKEALAEFNSDPRFVYVYQNNTKESGARNNGMRLAKGEWICLLDSDDIFRPNHLEILHKRISENQFKPGIYHTLVMRILPDGSTKPQTLALRNPDNLVWGIYKNELLPSSSCMHSSISKAYTFREDIFSGEDSEFFCRVALDYPIITIEEHTVDYMVHPQSAVEVYGARHVYFGNRILYWFTVKDNERLSSKFPKGFLNEKIAQHYQWKGMSHAANREHLETIKCYFWSAYYWPSNLSKLGFFKELVSLLLRKPSANPAKA